MAKADLRIEWDAHEYEHKERTQDWFWAVGIIAVSISIASIIFGNIIFGIFILVATFSLSLYINRPPEILKMRIDSLGIARNKIYYPFETIHSFCIDIEHPHKKILLRSKKMFMPLIVIPLGEEVSSDKVNSILKEFLPEEYQQLPFLENVLEFLGF
ncbi:MAG: hypothetical protein WAV25_01065 [Minisyncoccia bacterium]